MAAVELIATDWRFIMPNEYKLQRYALCITYINAILYSLLWLIHYGISQSKLYKSCSTHMYFMFSKTTILNRFIQNVMLQPNDKKLSSRSRM